MEQAVDMILVGCMAFLCALGLQEAGKPHAHTDIGRHVQSQANDASVSIIGIGPVTFALLLTDLAEAFAGRPVSSGVESIEDSAY